MNITPIDGFNTLMDKVKNNKKSWLMLYKSGNESSECALENLTASVGKIDKMCIMSADVAQVRDIHTHYDIKTVPTLVHFEEGSVKKMIKGCQSEDYYSNLLEEAAFFVSSDTKESKPLKRVTVYTTPTCSWCNTLKTHLRKNNVKFTEIDVSKDQSAAQAMVAKSGQQGVPQTDINGQMIIGFDKVKINQLLEIQG